MFPKVRPDNLSEYFATQKLRLSKCLEPKMECEGAPIRAHSIGKSSVIALLEADGHVITFRPRLEAGGEPKIEYESVGRNNASTFTGLCTQHDAELFRPIDTKILDTSNKEQLFLLAYRAVTREVHAVMEGAAKIQTAYSSRVQRGLDPKDEASPAGMFATQHLLKAFMTWRYRQEFFDIPLMEGKFDTLTHDTITFEGQRPTIAVSSLFSTGWNEKKDDVTCVALNVLPVDENTTVAVFSYASTGRRSRTSRIKSYSLCHWRLSEVRALAHHPAKLRKLHP